MSSKMRPNQIFICYRRDDAPGHAGHIHDGLKKPFKGRLFFDRSNLRRPGNFVETIRRAASSCYVLLVVIGRHWLVDEGGRRRLDEPEDYVRLEIETALANKAAVVPVLVEDAAMPAAKELPPELRALTFQTAMPLSDARWDYDMSQLVEALRAEVARVSRERKGDRSVRASLARAWGRAKGPLRQWFVRGLKMAPFVVPTLVVPNAFIIGLLTQCLASRYRRFGSVDYIINDPSTYVQLALIQSAAVFVYSGIWLAAYGRLRRRRDAKRKQAAADKPRDTPRTETGGRV